jgi:hypothetical protein
VKPPLFQQTIAEYTCSKHCGYHRSVASANLVLFHLAVAAAAALPLWIRLLGSPWYFPWYYLISILAGELLLVILSGFVSSVVLMPFMAAGTTICRNCAGELLYTESDYIMSLKTPQRVRDLAAALQNITEEEFQRRYFAIDAKRYGFLLSEEDFSIYLAMVSGRSGSLCQSRKGGTLCFVHRRPMSRHEPKD